MLDACIRTKTNYIDITGGNSISMIFLCIASLLDMDDHNFRNGYYQKCIRSRSKM
jgi:hypothetical protein